LEVFTKLGQGLPGKALSAEKYTHLQKFIKIYLEIKKGFPYLCISSLIIHLSRKAEGNGPMKP
jgi:hypothetical protein